MKKLMIILWIIGYALWLGAVITEEASVLKKTPTILPEEIHSPAEVELFVTVLADSSVGKVSILKTAGPYVDSLSVQTVKKWTFKPAFYDREAITSSLKLAISWQVKPADDGFSFKAAEIIKRAKPVYPDTLGNYNPNETYTVSILVDTQGKAIDANCKSPLPSALKSALMKSLAEWEFVPAQLNGEAVNNAVTTEIRFSPPVNSINRYEAVAESLGFNPIILKSRLDTFNTKNMKKQTPFRGFYYYDNSHLISLSTYSAPVVFDGFSVLPSYVRPEQTLSRLLRFGTYSEQGFLTITPLKYEYPVLYSRIEAALGYENLSYADLSFYKAELFGIKGLYLNSNIFNRRGLWLSVDESTTDFNFNLKKTLDDFTFEANLTKLDNDFSPFLLPPSLRPTYTQPISAVSTDVNFKLSWKNFYFGAKNYEEKISHAGVDSLKTTATQYLAGGVFDFAHNRLELNEEVLREHQAWQGSFKAKNYFEYGGFNSEQAISTKFPTSMYYLNKSGYRFAGYNFGLVYRNLQPAANAFAQTSFEDKALFGEYRDKNSALLCEVGLKHERGRELLYSDGELSFSAKMDSLTFFLAANVLYRNGIDCLASRWQITTDSYLLWGLPYDNAIKVGINHQYHGRFYDISNTLVYQGDITDLYAELRITNYFILKIEAKNILSSGYIAGNYAYPTHYNAGLTWVFFN